MSKTAREVLAEHARDTAIYSGFPDADAANLEFADDTITALDAAGFVIVPASETLAMLEAGRNESSQFVDGSASEGGPRSWFLERDQVSAIYRAMIAESQKPNP